MSNHYSGPDFGFPGGDARLDICDLWVFPAPGDARKSTLMMAVHSLMGVNPPGPTKADAFAPEAAYEFKIDTNADAVADITYRFRFSPLHDGVQTATVRRLVGGAPMDVDGETLFSNVPVSLAREAHVASAGEYQFFAGLRSDAFFADALGALNGFQFTGADFFENLDVYGIVLEVPNSALGPNPPVGVWSRVLIPAADAGAAGKGNGWVQVERAGRPEQVNFYLAEDKLAYNAGEPAQDRALYLDKIAHALEHAGKYPTAEARAVAASLLPDILPYDYTRPAGYPANGRTLSDDVFDDTLARLTNGQVTGDGVGPHTDLLAEFPYLGTPHGA